MPYIFMCISCTLFCCSFLSQKLPKVFERSRNTFPSLYLRLSCISSQHLSFNCDWCAWSSYQRDGKRGAAKAANIQQFKLHVGQVDFLQPFQPALVSWNRLQLFATPKFQCVHPKLCERTGFFSANCEIVIQNASWWVDPADCSSASNLAKLTICCVGHCWSLSPWTNDLRPRGDWSDNF